MTLSVVIISNITVIVVADFLLAASLTVRHGLPGRRRLRGSGGERRGLGRRWRGAVPWGRQAGGRRRGGAGRAGYRPAAGPRARTWGRQRRQLATLGRGRGPPNLLRRPRGGGARPLRLHGGGGSERLLQFGKRGFLTVSNLHGTATQHGRKRIFF